MAIMITIALLDDLLKRMQSAGLTELEVQDGDATIAMRLGAAVTATARKSVPVRTQGVGIFRATHPRRPDSAPKPGDKLLKGTALGYLEASGTLTAIIAPTSGTLSDTHAIEGELLGYGAHVFTLEESA
jgi:biotin carboxyl carrier protein